MLKPLRILVVADSEAQTRQIGEALLRQGLHVKWERVQTPTEMIGALGQRSWDVIISEHRLARMCVDDAIRVLRQLELDTPLFVITGDAEGAAAEVMKSGARDIFSHGRLGRLGPAIQRELTALADRADAAEEADNLRKERDFANRLFDTAEVIVLVLDTEGRILRFNPYLEQLSGYSLSQVRGKRWTSTFIPQSQQARAGALFRSKPRGAPIRGDTCVLLTRSGQEREIEWYDTTLKNSAGRVMGLLAIGHDVTDRKRT